MKKSIAISLFCLTLTAAGQAQACEAPASKPEIPDPLTAATAQMVKANNEVKAYVAAMTEYINCSRMSSTEQRKAVKELEDFAAAFNEAIREFKARNA